MVTPNEIIGDLLPFNPEEDQSGEIIERDQEGNLVVTGAVDLEDLSHELGVALQKGYNSTIGGYLCEKLGVIPEVGARYTEGGYLFVVLNRDERQIRRVVIKKEG